MFFWSDDKANIFSAISGCNSVFKFILKTKNEPELVDLWINHHLSIKGCDQVVVFDNLSTMSEVFDIYKKYQADSRVIIISFDGHHNLIHYPYFRHALYAALINSCEYYMFLDTDEFVYQFCPNRGMLSKEIILDESFTWAPGVWINDAPNIEGFFSFNKDSFNGGLLWGKPLISNKINLLNLNATINHNAQFYKAIYDVNFSSSLVVLHYKNAMPERRLRVNYEKLMKSHGLSADVSYADFISRIDEVDVLPTGLQYINEVKKIIKNSGGVNVARSDGFRLTQDLELDFNSSDGKINFINCFQYDRFLSWFDGEVCAIDSQEIIL